MNDNTEVIEVQPRPITEDTLKMTEINQIDTLVDEMVTKKFVNGIHFGKIPGIAKECLFQPGAQLFNSMFRVYPRYKTDVINLPNNHINVISTCSLYTMKGVLMGTAQGSCSTMESKYRYRSDYISTGKPVPKAYWKTKDINLIGGKGYAVKKVDVEGKVTEEKNGQWVICEASGKIENPDIADQWNTILKMSNKRAYVGATQSAWSLSGRYTQDVEDMQDNTKASNNHHKARTDEAKSVNATVVDEPATPPEKKPETSAQEQKELDKKFVDNMGLLFDEANSTLVQLKREPFKGLPHFRNAVLKWANETSQEKRVTSKAVDISGTLPETDDRLNRLTLIDMFVTDRVKNTPEVVPPPSEEDPPDTNVDLLISLP